MSSMHKTTLYLDDDLYARVQREAEARGTTQALVVREAIAAHVGRRMRTSKSAGLGRSGKGDLSERAEELLWSRVTSAR
jgi:predicted transcriptional regulator